MGPVSIGVEVQRNTDGDTPSNFEFAHSVEKSRARAREARKMHFCTQSRSFAHAHYKLEFDDVER